MCEDIPPSNYVEGGVLKGISIELLHAIWDKAGVPEQPVKVVPWARGYNLVLNAPGHVLFSMTRTPERDTLFKWVGPIFTVRNILMGLDGRKYRIASLDDSRQYRIGVIKGDVVESFLLGKGFDPQRIEAVSDLGQNFEKLLHGRVDLIAHSENTLADYIATKGLRKRDFSTKFVLSTSPNYYAFHLGTPDTTIRRLQSALVSIRSRHAELLARYGLAP